MRAEASTGKISTNFRHSLRSTTTLDCIDSWDGVDGNANGPMPDGEAGYHR